MSELEVSLPVQAPSGIHPTLPSMPLSTDVEAVPRILCGAKNGHHGDHVDGQDHCHLHATRQNSKERSLQGSLPLTLSDRIPIELFENIIDRMERHALPAAALVSRV